MGPKVRGPAKSIFFEWPGLGKVWLTPDELRLIETGKSVIVRKKK